MAGIIFEQLRENQIEAAAAIIKERVDWLLEKGSKQYLKPFPRSAVSSLQQSGYLFGMNRDSQLLSVVSVRPFYLPLYWAKHAYVSRSAYISTLFTNLDFRGQQLGRITLLFAEQHIKSRGLKIGFLDCFAGCGFLRSFYQRDGWNVIEAAEIEVPNPWRQMPAIFMKKNM